MKQLKSKEIKEIRDMLAKKTNYICPISHLDISNGDACLDHAHQASEHPLSETVEGQVRGTIHKYANSLEGQMRSKFRRSGLASVISFEEFLLNLYNYLMEFREPMIHPMSAPKSQKLMKSSYNHLVREINECNKYLQKPIKVPPYPKSKRLTKKLKELYDKMGIDPKFYIRKVK
jgi:hypothetical protein